MSDHGERRSGLDQAVRVECPLEVGGSGERAWAEVRPLTWAEALERESLGLSEEYELVSTGLGEPQVRVRRTYDLRLMAEYDWERCVVAYSLPEWQADGTVAMRQSGRGDEGHGEFLGRLPPAWANWLHEQIERVNQRLPAQRAELDVIKKKLAGLGRSERLSVRLEELLEGHLPVEGERLREGRDFASQTQLAVVAGGLAARFWRLPRWAWRVLETLEELGLHQATGVLPGPASCDDQPWWRVELWQAYWRARQQQ